RCIHPAGSGGASGRRLRRRDQARLLPASRPDAGLLPRDRRGGVHGAPDRALLPERAPEGEPPPGRRLGEGGRGGAGKMLIVSEQAAGQYVTYTFFKVRPEWRRLPIEDRAAAKDAFAEVVEELAPRFDTLNAYSTTGVRPDCDFFFWKITQRYEDLGEFGTALNATPLAGYLETPYSYLATTKASQYTSARRARKITPRQSPYLVVYPFVKVRPWYALTESDRQRAMNEHIRIC